MLAPECISHSTVAHSRFDRLAKHRLPILLHHNPSTKVEFLLGQTAYPVLDECAEDQQVPQAIDIQHLDAGLPSPPPVSSGLHVTIRLCVLPIRPMPLFTLRYLTLIAESTPE